MEQTMMNDLTVREIADILKVSKTTVQKAIKAAAISCDYVERNRQYYKSDKAKQIILSIRADFDISSLENSQTKTENSQTDTENQTANSQTQTEKAKTKTENSQTETENSQTSKSEEIAALHRLIDLVQLQLAEKDKQLAVKDKQIQDLSDRLAEAMQLTQGQQYIAAADKTKQLMDSKKAAEEPIEVTPAPATENEETDPLAAQEPPQKKSFWARLLGK